MYKVEKRDVVKLGAHAPYTPEETNPTIKSSFECKGTVYRIEGNFPKRSIYVKWSNGCSNVYMDGDLHKISDSGSYLSIWEYPDTQNKKKW